MANGDNFVIHKNKGPITIPGFQTIIDKPPSSPCLSIITAWGFISTKEHSRAFEINFDHAKYIVTNGQTVHVTGKIDGIQLNGDSVLNPSTFLHF